MFVGGQEERRKKKEEDEQTRRAERELKMAEFEKMKNPQKRNFIITKRDGAPVRQRARLVARAHARTRMRPRTCEHARCEIMF